MQISLKKLFTPLSHMPSYPGAYNCVGFPITPQMNFTFLHSCPLCPLSPLSLARLQICHSL